LILWARTPEALKATALDIATAGGEAVAFPVDLADATAVAAAARAVCEQGGPPDVIVNNAGAGRWLAVDESTPEDAVAAMAVPYFAAFYTTNAFLPGMIARGRGHLVNVTSPAGFLPVPGATTYAVARWAVRGFTEQLAADLAGTGIRVTLVVPGLVSSSYFEHNPGALDRLPRIVPRLSPTLTPDQVADALVRGVERDRRVVITPFALRVILGIHRLMPGPVEWLLRRTGWRRAGVKSGASSSRGSAASR
jgi:short-subunit dehydrogenase